jgi:hypothetical protein
MGPFLQSAQRFHELVVINRQDDGNAADIGDRALVGVCRLGEGLLTVGVK